MIPDEPQAPGQAAAGATLAMVGLRATDVIAAHLEPVGPKARTIEGAPFESELVLHKDDAVEMGIWEVTPGVFAGSKDGVCELMHIVAGAGAITDASGAVTEIAPGVVMFAADGWRGTWNVTSTVRKTYVIANTPNASPTVDGAGESAQ